jgi:hypothetical protein
MFEACDDRIGVLAPMVTFDPDLVHPEEKEFDRRAELELAAEFLHHGFPGSSLAVARNVSEYMADDDDGVAGAQAMRAAYIALGRDFLAARVYAYLVRHSG